MTTPTDSLAAIVAELRTTGIEWLHEKADRIERLDAEMQTYVRIIEQDKSDLRARLAACEKDAERYRWLRKEAYVLDSRHREGRCAYEIQTEDIAMWIKRPLRTNDASIDAAIDAALPTRASVPKDAATGDEGEK